MWNDRLQPFITIHAFISAKEVIFNLITHYLRLSQLKQKHCMSREDCLQPSSARDKSPYLYFGICLHYPEHTHDLQVVRSLSRVVFNHALQFSIVY